MPAAQGVQVGERHGVFMEKIDKILNHDLFLRNLALNNKAEADRCFCRHNMEHLLNVARIAWIINLEEDLGMDKELVYATALLHDIGRHLQYETGIPHEMASGEIAPGILKDCGFSEGERTTIVEAVLNHRNGKIAENKDLSGLLYRADKASRACFACRAQENCNWSKDKKNLQIIY